MFISQVHTHTLSSILMILQTPRQRGKNLLHQSGAHTHIHPLFNNSNNTDATADGDKFCSFVRYTHIYCPYKTHDNTDATADGVTPSSPVRNTHILSLQNTLLNTLMIIQKIKQTPRQMEMPHVHQSGVHTHKLFLYYSRKHRRYGRWRYIMFISQAHTHTHTHSTIL